MKRSHFKTGPARVFEQDEYCARVAQFFGMGMVCGVLLTVALIALSDKGWLVALVRIAEGK